MPHRPNRPRGGARRPRGLLTVGVAAAAILAVLASPRGPSPGAPEPVATAAPARTAGGADGGGMLELRDPPAPRPTPTPVAASPTSSVVVTPDRIGPPPRLAPEGWLVAGGTSPVAGSGGPLVTYTVELATSEQLDLDAVAATVTAVLSDPDHGWTATGRWRLQRVDDPRAAGVRVLLADPDLVDGLCADAGLDTRGYFSCFNGTFAALNVDRWLDGVPHVGDLDLYRTYLVNHEVGHGLGYPHESCPADGAVAPVMMQLTMSDEGCRPNGVPFP